METISDFCSWPQFPSWSPESLQVFSGTNWEMYRIIQNNTECGNVVEISVNKCDSAISSDSGSHRGDCAIINCVKEQLLNP